MNNSFPSKIVRNNFSEEPSFIESINGEKSLMPVDSNRQQPINSKVKPQFTEKIMVKNSQRSQNFITGSEIKPSELLQQSEQSAIGGKYIFHKRSKDSKSNLQSEGLNYEESNNNLQRYKEKNRQRELRNLDNMQLVDWNQSNAQNEIEIIEHIPTDSAIRSNKTITRSQICLDYTNIFDTMQINTRLQCTLKRNKKAQSGILQYQIYLQGNNQHVLTIRKEGIWQYIFYLRQPNQEGTFSYRKLARLNSSFFSNQFTLIKEGEKFSNCTICYESNFLGLSGPRKMHIYLAKAPVPYEYLDECYGDLQYREKIEKCINKQPVWSKKENSYVQTFRGRAPVSSIKNFVITDKDGNQNKYLLVFGKAGDQIYNLDIESPFSLVQGVAVAITSFEHKITCD